MAGSLAGKRPRHRHRLRWSVRGWEHRTTRERHADAAFILATAGAWPRPPGSRLRSCPPERACGPLLLLYFAPSATRRPRPCNGVPCPEWPATAVPHRCQRRWPSHGFAHPGTPHSSQIGPAERAAERSKGRAPTRPGGHERSRMLRRPDPAPTFARLSPTASSLRPWAPLATKAASEHRPGPRPPSAVLLRQEAGSRASQAT